MTRRRTQPGPAHSTRGFTLIELLVSVSITAILLAGTTSVILVMGHALPSREDDLVRSMPAAQAANRIAAELQEATSIVFAGPTAVEFTVADRDSPADNVDETIRYAWSGVPGDPLTRRYNGGTAYTVLDDVREFDLDYDQMSFIDGDPPLIEGPEQAYVMQDGTNSGVQDEVVISDSYQLAQTFLPVLPLNAVSWRITRFQLHIRADQTQGGATSGQIAMRLEETDLTGAPMKEIDELIVFEDTLPRKTALLEFSFPNAGGLDPLQPYAISIHPNRNNDKNVARLLTGSPSLLSPTTRYFFDNGFKNWTEELNRDLWITVWGRAEYVDPDWVPPIRIEMRSVNITLNTGTTDTSRIVTGAPTLNRPSLP